MIKAKVLIEFYDVKTYEKRMVGDIFECTEERFEEINSVKEGIVEKYIEDEAKTDDSEEEKEGQDESVDTEEKQAETDDSEPEKTKRKRKTK